MTQFHIENGYHTEAEAKREGRSLALRFISDLESKGYGAFSVPPMPPTGDGEVFLNCRILVQYVLPWLPSPYADQFAVRVDTLVEQSAREPAVT